MNKAIAALVILALIGVGTYLALPDTSPLYETVNVVAVKTQHYITTSSPQIANYTPQITVDHYTTRKLMFLNRTEDVSESQRNCFAEKLSGYMMNMSLTLKHTVSIYINETDQLIYSKEFEFTKGADSQVTIYFSNSTFPLVKGTMLRIEVEIYLLITMAFPGLSEPYIFEKDIKKTFYVQLGSSTIQGISKNYTWSYMWLES